MLSSVCGMYKLKMYVLNFVVEKCFVLEIFKRLSSGDDDEDMR